MIKNSRSIYCSESEYQRLKIALTLIRIHDSVPVLLQGENIAKESFWKIMKGLEPHD